MSMKAQIPRRAETWRELSDDGAGYSAGIKLAGVPDATFEPE